MKRPPRLQALHDAALARPVRGALSALLICVAGLLLRAAEHLIDVPRGSVYAAAEALHRNKREETP